MEEQTQTKFEGFALVEIMGHRRAAGMVTTEYIGTAAFLRIVTPELPATEVKVENDRHIGGEWIYAGSVMRVDRPRQEILVGTGSIYAISPCTEEEIIRHAPVRQTIVRRAERPALAAPETEEPEISLDEVQV